MRAYFLILFLGFLASFTPAQTAFESFWDEFKRAVKNDDENKIIELCQFPMKGNVDEVDSEEGYNEGEFLKDFDNYFDVQGKATIRKTSITEMTYTDITSLEIPNLSYHKGYTLFITYQYPEFETESTMIFTFAFVDDAWKLARIDKAG